MAEPAGVRTVCTGSIEAVVRFLAEHGTVFFPVLNRITNFSVERVKLQSTNPLRRFVLSDGLATASVIAKWAPIYDWNNEGHTEFNHYSAFCRSYATEVRFQCPRPIAFLSPTNVLLLQEECGVPVLKLLRHPYSCLHKTIVKLAVRNCAAWLAAFHSLSPTCLIPACRAFEELRDSELCFNDKLEFLQPDVKMVIWEMQKAANQSTSLYRIGGVHADFGPSNVLVRNEHVFVLDAACNRAAAQVADVAVTFARHRSGNIAGVYAKQC